MCILEKVSQPLLRYGNPDIQILGTLKNKFQISIYLTPNMKNLMLHFGSGFPFYIDFCKKSIDMVPLKILNSVLLMYCPKTYITGNIFISYLPGTKFISIYIYKEGEFVSWSGVTTNCSGLGPLRANVC